MFLDYYEIINKSLTLLLLVIIDNYYYLFYNSSNFCNLFKFTLIKIKPFK